MGVFDRFPSLDELVADARVAAMRFPLSLLCAVVGTFASILLVEAEQPEGEYLLQKIVMVVSLGLPLFLALATLAEKTRRGPAFAIGLQGAGVVFLVVYFFVLPADVMSSYSHAVRLALFSVGFHFLAACLPWLGKGEVGGYWQYNKSLFIRALMAALYSAVIYAGLAIALASADYLFGMDIDGDRYFELWIVAAGTLSAWIFLAGVPRDLDRLDCAADYPEGLRVFAQFVLLPLVGLYFVILIAYEAKIIVTWNWPKGWVSQLVLWYSVVGLLSLLLLHPLREKTRWLRIFSAWFFRALIPLAAMLFLAILRRVTDYGVTEPRYFVLALAVGLAAVTLYFVLSKAQDIRIVPITLCLLCFASAVGPWSAFSISKASQTGRLEAIMTANGMLADGGFQQAPTDLSFDDRKNMSSVIEYLSEWHGAEALSACLPAGVLSGLDTTKRYARPRTITEQMGFAFVDSWKTSEGSEYFSIHASADRGFDIAGYDYLMECYAESYLEEENSSVIGADTVSVRLDSIPATLTVRFSGEVNGAVNTAAIPLSDALAELVYPVVRDDSVPPDKLTFESKLEDYDLRVLLGRVGGSVRSDTVVARTAEVRLLVSKKK